MSGLRRVGLQIKLTHIPCATFDRRCAARCVGLAIELQSKSKLEILSRKKISIQFSKFQNRNSKTGNQNENEFPSFEVVRISWQKSAVDFC
jgi:hypothetical protein